MLILGNVLANLPTAAPDEASETLLHCPGLRILRIVSHGHVSPPGFWYDQSDHEWVMVISGSARLIVEGHEPVTMQSGSFINLPAHTRHRVEWTDPNQPTVWLAIHYDAAANP